MANAEVTFNFSIDRIREQLQGEETAPLRRLFETIAYERLIARLGEDPKPLAPNFIRVTPFSSGETLGFVLDSCVELADGSRCQVAQDSIDFKVTDDGLYPMIMRDENEEQIMGVPQGLATKIAALGMLYSAELIATR